MKKQKGFIVPILIALVTILVIGGGVYVYQNNKTVDTNAQIDLHNEKVADQNLSTSNSSTTVSPVANSNKNPVITQTSTPAENSISEDTYQNGRFPGFVKSVNKDKNGNVTIGIDIIQAFSGQDAFLALAEDFNNGTNVHGDWTLAKDRFKSFNELSKYVKSLSYEQFNEFFHAYQAKAQEFSVSPGIFNSFPNGYLYYRNVSSKIRNYQVSPNVKNVSITNSGEPINIEDYYAICTMNPTQAMSYIQKKGINNPFTCDNDVFIGVSKGVINKIEIVFHP